VKSRPSHANSPRIISSEKSLCNPFVMNSSKTLDLKPRRMNRSEKRWGVGVLFHRVVLHSFKNQVCFLRVSPPGAPDSSPPCPNNRMCSLAPLNVSTFQRSTCQLSVLLPCPNNPMCPPNGCPALAPERSAGSERSEFRGTFPQAEQEVRLVGWMHHISTWPHGGWAEVAESIST
jgi:hypothetical protein